MVTSPTHTVGSDVQQAIWRGYYSVLASHTSIGVSYIGEPFLPAKYRVKEDTNFTMTPEFTIIVKQKENEVEDMMEELEGSEVGDKVNPDEVRPSTTHPEPQNEDVGDDVKLLHQV